MDIIKCPGCQRSRFRNPAGQRAICRSCSQEKRRVFQFCCACQREWPRHASSTDACMLPNCALRAALLGVKKINDPQSSVNGCPYFRACPGCKALLTHTGLGCPSIVCPHCNNEFCFRCMRPYCYDNEYYDSDDSDDSKFESCVIKNNREILRKHGL